MSILAPNPPIAPIDDMFAPDAGSRKIDSVVEISLLLPSQWADDLFALSKERQQSVGEILRSMIGQALHQSLTKS